MGNTFGTSSVQVKLVDPRHARRYRQRFRRDAVRELFLANSLYVPCGRQSVRGWILLTRADYDSVRGYGTNYQLQIDQFDPAAPALTLRGLSIVTAQCVATGVLGDPAALYLVELTDARGILKNQWFSFPTKTYYNVLAPAYPGKYYYHSLNAGLTWSWSGMIGDLWTQIASSFSSLGPYSGLPASVGLTGIPINWNLNGVPCWDALCDVLEHLGLAVGHNPASATPYTIVSLGDDDTTFDTLTTRHSHRLEDDMEPIDLGAGRVPGTVIVYFRRINELYGTEETVRNDSHQWATNAVYPVSVSAPAAFAGAPGTGFLYDDFCVRQDINGVLLPVDVTQATNLAEERVRQYFDVIYSRTSGAMNRTYTGVLPFYAGSQIDGVCWKQDLRDRRAGWTTQILRGDLWREVYGAS